MHGEDHSQDSIACLSSLLCRIIADKQIPLACIKFAEQRGQLLREKGLVPNFLSHMINLFDFGLVSPSTLREGMEAVMGVEKMAS